MPLSHEDSVELSDGDVTVEIGSYAHAESMADNDLPSGAQLGRYTILHHLGEGGMGVVYAAYDPSLDRKVALKLLVSDFSHGDTLGPSRMAREAQALAQLSHPNVVAVHDVQIEGRGVFIAMEYVDGPTLKEWIHRPHSWSEVLEVYVSAGRGLEAAHRAGIVHRDFKPSNVLIGNDGRVRVLDFGLARGLNVVDPSEVQPPSAFTDGDRVTQAGEVLGTPAYMSPEQLAGDAVDQRTDIFSFCIALFEALYKRHPFPPGTEQSYRDPCIRGAPQFPPSASSVPRWIAKILVKGLQTDPQDRWQSMTEILDALQKGALRRRRRTTWGAGVAASLLLGGSAAYAAFRPSICEALDERFDGVWDDSARTRIIAGFERFQTPFASATAERVANELDTVVSKWAEARRNTCEAGQIHHELSQQVTNVRFECLDRVQREIHTTVELLQDPSEDLVARAVGLVQATDTISSCETLQAWDEPTPDPDVAAEVAAIGEELDQVQVWQRASLDERAIEATRPLLKRAAATGFAPIKARATYVQAVNLSHAGKYAEGADLGERSYLTALGARDDRQAATSAVFVAHQLLRQGRQADAKQWLGFARAEAERLKQPDRRLAREIELLDADVIRAAGKIEEALAAYNRALAISTEFFPDEPVPGIWNNLGNVYNDLSRHQDALNAFHNALEAMRQAVGPEHPNTAIMLNNIANTLVDIGREDEAEAIHREALRIRESALGPDHPWVAYSLHNLAIRLQVRGDVQTARVMLERALAIRTNKLEPNDPNIPATLLALAALEEPAAAEARLRRALEILERSDGSGSYLAIATNNLADRVYEQGRHEEALGLYERALEQRRQALDVDDHPDLGFALFGIAKSHYALGRPERAIDLLERAIDLRRKTKAQPELGAHAQFLLARALHATHADHEQVRRAAESAKQAWQQIGNPDQLAVIDRWLHHPNDAPP